LAYQVRVPAVRSAEDIVNGVGEHDAGGLPKASFLPEAQLAGHGHGQGDGSSLLEPFGYLLHQGPADAAPLVVRVHRGDVNDGPGAIVDPPDEPHHPVVLLGYQEFGGLALMHPRHGLRAVNFGIESSRQDLLGKVGRKAVKVADQERIIRYCEKKGIKEVQKDKAEKRGKFGDKIILDEA